MQPHQERVVVEAKELDDKMTKLREFVRSETYKTLKTTDGDLLRDQYFAMEKYHAILQRRIARFAGS
jgi:hypothetical protein